MCPLPNLETGGLHPRDTLPGTGLTSNFAGGLSARTLDAGRTTAAAQAIAITSGADARRATRCASRLRCRACETAT